MQALLDFRQGLTDLVFPPVCLLCEELADAADRGFCRPCLQELTADAAPTCPRCASTVGPFAETSEGCVRCRRDVCHFNGVYRLGLYGGRLRQAILRIKRAEGEALAWALGGLLAARLHAPLAALGIAAVVPLPLHWLRRLKRGYNQAEAAAEPVAAGLGASLRPGWLRRVKLTPAQSSLTPSERRLLPRGVFRGRAPATAKGANLLLVDDVLTTGSTANAAAWALKRAGAGAVWVAVLARADS